MQQQLRKEFLDKLSTPLISERLFAQVPDILFCIKNIDRVYVSANRAFADRLGLRSHHDIIGKTAHDLFPAHLADSYNHQDQIIVETGKEIIDKLELINNRTGGIGWYLASKFPLYDHDQNVLGIASISRDLMTPRDEDLKFAGLARTVEFIQANFADDLKLNDLASNIKLSITQLDRRMKKIFKLTTSQFIRKVRLEAAAHSLLRTENPISTIAQDSGYGDQSAFTRQFKATVGLTPGDYRALARSN